VRSPSSFAARKIRMAISLRLAASNFLIGCNFVGRGLIRDAIQLLAAKALRESYIVSRARRETSQFFRWRETDFYWLIGTAVPPVGPVVVPVGLSFVTSLEATAVAAFRTGGGALFSCFSCSCTRAHTLGLALVVY